MMSRSALHIIVLVALLIHFTCVSGSTLGVGEPSLRCKEAERRALLKIKEDLQELEDGVLSSWGKGGKRECCEWIGIQCDNLSDHVIKLDLSPPTFGAQDSSPIRGNISSSLVELQYLKYLDLSTIDFSNNFIPSFIGTLNKLNYLNLSHTSLSGKVPLQLGNISSLQSLDLRSNNALEIVNLKWVSPLSSLQLLDLSHIDMRMANDWVHVVNNLPYLTTLKLHDCRLPNVSHPSPIPLVNSSKVLATLDLSQNHKVSESTLFQLLFNYNYSLVHLDLSMCNLKDSILKAFGNMSTLAHLDLKDNELEGSIPEYFGNLPALAYLDLTSNHLVSFPKYFGNLSALARLDLKDNELEGSIPEYFGNLSALAHLDLRSNHLEGSIPEYFGNLSALAHLDLGSNHLEGSIPEFFGNMFSLAYLDLSDNKLEGSIPKSFGNMFSLAYLDLGHNQLEGSIPESFRNMSALAYLDLGSNQLESFSPESFRNMSAIEFVDFAGNQLEGPIPEAFGEMTTLKHLDLSNNSNLEGEISKSNWISMEHLDLSSILISGPLPNFTHMQSLVVLRLSSTQLHGNVSESIGELSGLSDLDISANSLEAVISEAHFSKLFNLWSLNLSYNPGLVLDMSPDWNPPFQLSNIDIRYCQLGHFLKWIQTQKGIKNLDVPSSKILGCIPNTFWNFAARLIRVDLSNNEISGAICDNKQSGGYVNISNFGYHPRIDLSSNKLEGPIPQVLFEVSGALNLSSNRFSELHSLCNVTTFMPLIFLDVSYNQLSGDLPDCWSHMRELQILSLAYNKLSGRIPVSIGRLTMIDSLYLGNNSLIGELPTSLKELRNLSVFDVSENYLSGLIPTWIGKSVKQIAILNLRSNNFNGSIPSSLCLSENLQVLDLASNDLSSNIPTCLGNLKAMKESRSLLHAEAIVDDYFYDAISEVWKGEVHELKNLFDLKNVDLSSNKLTGEIPREITELVELVSLNLSRNHLSGQIPREIGQLKSLDALDLSKNHLSGSIPLSLSQIDRLSTLDLSNNSLSGKIPTGTQLQTRDASAYIGNPELCGDPLQKCPGEKDPKFSGATKDDANNQEDQDEFITKGFYISAAAGFVVGFWGVCFTLIFKKSWRYSYFKSLNKAGDWIYVTVAVYKGKLLRIIKS